MPESKAHFIIQRADLVRELALVTGVTERRTTIPILGNVEVEVEGASAIFRGTDLEVGMTCIATVEVRSHGVITLPAKRLLDFVRLLPDGPVDFKVGDNDWVTILAGKSRTRIAGMGAASFPSFPSQPADDLVISTGHLIRLINQTSFAITTEESRFALRGALLEIGSGRMRMVATDGHRMAISEAESPGALRALIPARGLRECLRLCDMTGDVQAISFSQDENHYFFSRESRSLMVRKMSGTFPDYARVMPKEFAVTAIVATSEFKFAVDRAALMSDERSRSIKLAFQPGQLTITSSLVDSGESSESLGAEYSGGDLTVGLNAKYIADILAGCGSEKTLIGLKDGNSAVQFSPAGDSTDSYKCIVMPMRL